MHVKDKVIGIMHIRQAVIDNLFQNFDKERKDALEVEAIIATYVLAVCTRDISIQTLEIHEAKE